MWFDVRRDWGNYLNKSFQLFFTGKLYIFLSISPRLVCWYYYFSKYYDTIYLKIMEKEKTVLWKNASKEKRDFVPKKDFIIRSSSCLCAVMMKVVLFHYYVTIMLPYSIPPPHVKRLILYWTTHVYLTFFAFAHNMMLMIMIIYLTLLSILSSLSTQRHTHTQPIFSFWTSFIVDVKSWWFICS